MTVIDIHGTLISRDNEASMLLGGITDYTIAEDIISDIRNSEDDITLILNSGGGSYFAGAEIYSELKASNQKSTAYIASLAGSASAILAMGATKRVISESAQLMFHQSAIGAFGKSQDLKEVSQMLDSIDAGIAEVLTANSSLTKNEAKDFISTDNFVDAQRALDLKLVDEIGSVKVNAEAQGEKEIELKPQDAEPQAQNVLNFLGKELSENDMEEFLKAIEGISEKLDAITELLEKNSDDEQNENPDEAKKSDEDNKVQSDSDDDDDDAVDKAKNDDSDDVVDNAFAKAQLIQNALRKKL
ncbi:head maturation protease [Streptococcus phage APCM01]|uniref:head maturation protease n=1 Tax=Streptococcus phage APCM01 TaxID=1647391 RepID=UPI00067A5F94|nr:head maturation protease [Streptococcus phage APCM01]AKI28566.1 Clp protease [Streptococcus phage APCM01]